MKKFSLPEAKKKIQRYCVYRERSHQEVRNKLFAFGLQQGQVDELVSELITSNYLNEERFAKAFAGGKFRMKKWGRLKIIRALEAQGLTPNCIKCGLKEIDEADYEKAVHALVAKKNGMITTSNVYEQRDKISKAAILKGYEPDLVWRILCEALPDHK